MARLEARYEVKKINDPEGKHDECGYFVLDPQHDPFAASALRTYAEEVSNVRPELTKDINDWLRRLDYCPNCSQIKGHRGKC